MSTQQCNKDVVFAELPGGAVVPLSREQLEDMLPPNWWTRLDPERREAALVCSVPDCEECGS